VEVKDGNDDARALFDRHYSRYRYADGRQPKLFVGPGQKMVLLTPDKDALFVWRKFISADGQQGINCAIFRNESSARASLLLLSAMLLAWRRWPGERFYTYVNPRAIRSSNPGYCFKVVGWKKTGVTKRRSLDVLAYEPGIFA
jgi:hypothetical protein